MTAQREIGAVGRAFVWLIGLYQAVPRRRAGSCRFVPTCSAYASTAVCEHGVMRGGWLALRRLGRCRPGGGVGYDPVPPAGDDTCDAAVAAPRSPAASIGTALGDRPAPTTHDAQREVA